MALRNSVFDRKGIMPEPEKEDDRPLPTDEKVAKYLGIPPSTFGVKKPTPEGNPIGSSIETPAAPIPLKPAEGPRQPGEGRV